MQKIEKYATFPDAKHFIKNTDVELLHLPSSNSLRPKVANAVFSEVYIFPYPALRALGNSTIIGTANRGINAIKVRTERMV